jgi:MFS family permease
MSMPEEAPLPPRGVLASLALCMLLPSLAASIANVALPAMGESLGASFRQLQWVVLAYLLATTSVVVAAGRLADQLGRRRLLLAGVAMFTAASLLCGLAGSLAMLLAKVWARP